MPNMLEHVNVCVGIFYRTREHVETLTQYLYHSYTEEPFLWHNQNITPCIRIYQ